MKTYTRITRYGIFEATATSWGIFNAHTQQRSLAMAAYHYAKVESNNN